MDLGWPGLPPQCIVRESSHWSTLTWPFLWSLASQGLLSSPLLLTVDIGWSPACLLSHEQTRPVTKCKGLLQTSKNHWYKFEFNVLFLASSWNVNYYNSQHSVCLWVHIVQTIHHQYKVVLFTCVTESQDRNSLHGLFLTGLLTARLHIFMMLPWDCLVILCILSLRHNVHIHIQQAHDDFP